MLTRVMTLGLATLLASGISAAPLPPEQVPTPLKPWVDWVLHGHDIARCPYLAGGTAQRCVWPARLELDLDAKGGRFSQQVRVYGRAWVALPGDSKRWPLEVRRGMGPAVVVSREGHPGVELTAGEHTLSGRFLWDSLPEQLPIPTATGLLSLRVAGRAVPFPHRDEAGRVWLQRQGSDDVRQNRVDVQVHRRLVDDNPTLLVTHIEVEVSGESREELLGPTLPDGFVASALQGPLPARLEPNGVLRLQVRPGRHLMVLRALRASPASKLTAPKADKVWSSHEIWVFESRPRLRLVSVEEAVAVDPQQTRLPDDWRRLPAYRLLPGQSLALVERRRGDADPAPDQLALERTLWLDFDGDGLTQRDRISGALNRSWRLTMPAPTTLGRVAVDGQDQFITRLGEEQAVGVELRSRQVNVEAESRLEGRVSRVPIVGWGHDFQRVEAELRMPPGWRLLAARGVDEAHTTWIRSWSLLDLFVLLLVVIAAWRLWGWPMGLLALATLGLTFPETDAPHWIWPFVLAAEALVRALPEGRLKRWFRIPRLITLLVLLIIAIPFAVQQLRQGLYPALEHPWHGAEMAQASISSLPMGATQALDKEDEESFGDESFMQELEQDGRDKAEEPPALPMKPPPPPPQEQSRRRKIALEHLTKSGESYDVDGWGESAASTGLTRSMQKQFALDPKAVVQTGPGLPGWTWNEVRLVWNGPVDQQQQMRLVLLGPAANLVLAVARVLLLAALLLCALGFPRQIWARLGRIAARPTLWVLLLVLISPSLARAQDWPPTEMLDELRQRLLAPPDCHPDCASSPRLNLEVDADTLRIRVEVDVAAAAAVPLPGGAAHWLPSTVLVDSMAADGMALEAGDRLWLLLEQGRHQIVMQGPLPNREVVQLPLHLKPHRVEIRATDWVVDGVHEDGLADDVLQLTRQSRGARAALEAATLPPFVRITRTITLDLAWTVQTRIQRLTPVGSAAVLEVPLLAGESVTSAELRVERGKALVNMGPQASAVSWSSVLSQTDQIKLLAPSDVAWSEVWRLEASPIWHIRAEGIPTVNQAQGGSREWQPWPGESVSVDVSRPQGVPGQTLTIDGVRLDAQPGARAEDSNLELVLRSSRGGQHIVTLPEGAELQSAHINDSEVPLRQEQRAVTIPLTPGRQKIALRWRAPGGLQRQALLYRLPAIDVGSPGVNAELGVSTLGGRWILLLQPAQLGPAVLFWSLLAIVLIAAVALSRTTLAPLRLHHWLLLGVGLTQAPIAVAMGVTGWLLVLGVRQRSMPEGQASYNLIQIGLALWTLAAVGGLFAAVAQGLLGMPDMQIIGNHSSRTLQRWYFDRFDGALPRPWVLSVPLWVYRVAMLAWALWLAAALVRWLRWGWSCFNTGGLWKSRPVKAAAKPAAKSPSPPAQPTAPAPQPTPKDDPKA